MNLNITVDDNAARDLLRGMSQSVQTAALRQGVKRAADKGNTYARRQITSTYNVKAGDVRQRFRVKATTANGLPASVIVATGAKGRNLILFVRSVPRVRKGKRTRGKDQVVFEIKRGRRVTIPGAFVANFNKGRFVARRVGRPRLPIESLYTVDVPGMFSSRQIMNATIAKIGGEFLPQEIVRGIRDSVNRAARR